MVGRWRRGVCAGYGREECDKERERRIVWRERETKPNWFLVGLYFHNWIVFPANPENKL